jgi:adenine-specific DNA-methyltransferase
MDITTNEGSADIEKLGLDPSWFDYPKPVNLVKLLIEAASDKDSIILDFFAGSGTTAHAVMQRNSEDGGSRKFISVQLPEPLAEDHPARTKEMKTISDISIARIRAASAHFEGKADGLITDGENADFGFRAYKLADSCFAKWHVSSDTDVTKLEQHLFELRGSSLDGFTQDDMLTEILLKQGYSLSEAQSKIDVGSLTLKSVGDGLLLAYLAEDIKPTLEDLRLVLELQPAKLVILDDAFQGDDQLKTNLVQLCKSRGTELWSA